MRKFHSNLAFVDLLFNMLTGFVTLFIIAFLLINPIAEDGKIDPPVEFMITMEWNDESRNDIDMWMKAPGVRAPIGYNNKNRGAYSLDRDDLGASGEVIMIDGKETQIRNNIEVMNIRGIAKGEYVVNAFFYRKEPSYAKLGTKTDVYDKIDVEEVTFTLIDMTPFKVISTVKVKLEVFQEKTAFSFIVTPDGKIVDVRTDIQLNVTPTVAVGTAQGNV